MQEERPTWTPAPPAYQNIQWREVPQTTYNGGGGQEPYYGEPIRVENLHLPTYVEPVLRSRLLRSDFAWATTSLTVRIG
ncbi:hypothetical protein GS909_20585 [Rhodococcus hoagii]|nr:hypothetical protein [Prescottella equi]